MRFTLLCFLAVGCARSTRPLPEEGGAPSDAGSPLSDGGVDAGRDAGPPRPDAGLPDAGTPRPCFDEPVELAFDDSVHASRSALHPIAAAGTDDGWLALYHGPTGDRATRMGLDGTVGDTLTLPGASAIPVSIGSPLVTRIVDGELVVLGWARLRLGPVDGSFTDSWLPLDGNVVGWWVDEASAGAPIRVVRRTDTELDVVDLRFDDADPTGLVEVARAPLGAAELAPACRFASATEIECVRYVDVTWRRERYDLVDDAWVLVDTQSDGDPPGRIYDIVGGRALTNRWTSDGNVTFLELPGGPRSRLFEPYPYAWLDTPSLVVVASSGAVHVYDRSSLTLLREIPVAGGIHAITLRGSTLFVLSVGVGAPDTNERAQLLARCIDL
ncbi:MAG: hypothetical protein AB7P00_18460, partial [Sandaracinaceae bacterium]